MFIRVKSVKKDSGKIYEYACIVHGFWKRKRLRKDESGNRFFKNFNNSIHKYHGFLGKVHRFQDITTKINLEEHLGMGFGEFIEKHNVDDIYKKLLEFELISRGFRKNKGIYIKNKIFVDFNRLIVHDGKNDVVIKLRDKSGYLCSLNLDELFKINKISGRYEGIYLMKRLKMVGIELNAEQFYILVEKLLKN